jgi:chaperonin GroEL
VERIALQNAASIASLLLTTEALITDIPEENGACRPRRMAAAGGAWAAATSNR